jgi:excisionase family DNA binding protein
VSFSARGTLFDDERAEMNDEPEDRLLTPSEVAAMFAVNTKTVSLWANAGKIDSFRTFGGHRRFKASDVRRALERSTEQLG